MIAARNEPRNGILNPGPIALVISIAAFLLLLTGEILALTDKGTSFESQFNAAVGFLIGGGVLLLIAIVTSIAVAIEDQSPLAWSALAIAVLSLPLIGLIYFLFTALFYS
ncbi:hypothetical protein [Lacisediminihabitans sp.]|jgi:hypothetical protein|uniref:hypothetical protein n=1 Tax=Lacisediminihabitans sp. TaxID=2787631 RepID=UPI002F91D8AD